MSQFTKPQLLARAQAAGFSDARIARADLPPHYGQRVHEWVAAGMHGEMDYMQRTAPVRAQGADAVLPGAKSVIVFAAPYHPGPDGSPQIQNSEFGTQNSPPQHATVQIANYALGEDYHLVFRERLQPILDWLSDTIPGHAWRICTDSAPLNERAYAIESGIGFMGRNTMIIAPGAGSYLLLAEIVTTAELPHDLAITGTCGTCTRCIDACPTAAIREPLLVDATRCISYLTIEKKTELSPAEHASCGDWAFGCDICQDVCPYNKTPAPVQMPEFREGVRLVRREPASTFLQLLSNRQFARRFDRSPLLRAGKRRMTTRILDISQRS
jgi:epoxyqueuosine reductase